eukprot:6200590-Pleurochrysis_carterae.AAC.4
MSQSVISNSRRDAASWRTENDLAFQSALGTHEAWQIDTVFSCLIDWQPHSGAHFKLGAAQAHGFAQSEPGGLSV